MSGSAITGLRDPFRALVAGFVPESARLSPEGWSRGELIVEDLLSRRPASVRRQVRVLIRALDIYSVLRCGRRLSRLEAGRRDSLIGSLQDSRLLLLRRGVWGLRTLAFACYYGRPEVHAKIGYRAQAAGWYAVQATGDPETPGHEGRASDARRERPE